MIVVLLNVYLVILFILVKLKIVPFNLFWKISPVIVLPLSMGHMLETAGLHRDRRYEVGVAMAQLAGG